MEINSSPGYRWRTASGALIACLFVAAFAACSKSEPKPLAQPTPDQVRSHSERSFDNLKQEERDRGAVQPTER